MLNFSKEQITQFQKWKEDFHDEITRKKREVEKGGKKPSRFYNWLYAIERLIDTVEITTSTTVTSRLIHTGSTVNTKIMFGGLMERYSKELSHTLYCTNVEKYCKNEVDKLQLFGKGKIIELREIFNLFN